MKIKSIFLILPLAIFLNTGIAHADHKKEAKKKIDTLNHQVQEAADKGDLQKAITAAEEALTTANKEFGESSIEAAKAMNNVANLYLYSGNPVEAERLYKDAIIIEVSKYGKENTEIADLYYNLSMAYAMQKKFSQARKMMDLTIKVRKEKLGAEHPDTVKAQKMADTLWSESKSSE